MCSRILLHNMMVNESRYIVLLKDVNGKHICVGEEREQCSVFYRNSSCCSISSTISTICTIMTYLTLSYEYVKTGRLIIQ